MERIKIFEGFPIEHPKWHTETRKSFIALRDPSTFLSENEIQKLGQNKIDLGAIINNPLENHIYSVVAPSRDHLIYLALSNLRKLDTPHAFLNINQSTAEAVIPDSINYIVRECGKTGNLFLLFNESDEDKRNREFWRNLNSLREYFGTIPHSLGFYMTKKNYAYFLNSGDHLASWVVPRVNPFDI